MSWPEFQAWHRFAFKRGIARQNAQARAEWNARIEAMKRREGGGM